MEYIVANFTIHCHKDVLQAARDLLADAAGEAGFEAFEDTENGINGYAQKQLFNKEKLIESIADFPLENVNINFKLNDAEDKDWNEAWEENGFEPIDIDGKMVIVDAKHYDEDEQPKAKMTNQNETPIIIKIDAKLAFGTGNHETTQMIISTLLNDNVKGKRILDCGCGTGILSIASCKLGAEEVVAYDIDEWSVENTRHNAELNDVYNIKVMQGDASVLNKVDGLFDIVLANINRNILLHDMPAFKKKMKKESLLIISGFYQDDIKLLTEKAIELGLSPRAVKEKGQWRMIILSCPSTL